MSLSQRISPSIWSHSTCILSKNNCRHDLRDNGVLRRNRENDNELQLRSWVSRNDTGSGGHAHLRHSRSHHSRSWRHGRHSHGRHSHGRHTHRHTSGHSLRHSLWDIRPASGHRRASNHLACHQIGARTSQTTHRSGKTLRSRCEGSSGHSSSGNATATRARSGHLSGKLRMSQRSWTNILWRRTLNLQRYNLLTTQKDESERVLLFTFLNHTFL